MLRLLVNVSRAFLLVVVLLLFVPGVLRAGPGKPGVVVLYFNNNTNDASYDVLQKGLADMMVTDLSASDRIQVVERDRLDEILDELKLQKSDYFDPKTAVKIGKGIGAKYAVAGSIAAIEPKIRLDIRLIEVETGKILMADKVMGLKDEFFELESQLASKFLTALDLKLKRGKARTSGARTLESVMAYSKGVDSADKGNFEAASKHLAKVVAKAPEFKLAQKKYAEVVKRMHMARLKRNKLLASGEQVLLKNSLEHLGKKKLPEMEENDEIRSYMGYRVMLGQYYQWTLGKTIGLDKKQMQSSGITRIEKALRIEARKWMKTYYENTLTLVDEQRSIETHKDERLHGLDGGNYEVSDEDEKRAKDLGIKNPGKWTFAQSYSMVRSLAVFVFTGKAGFWTPFSYQVSPTLAQLDESIVEPTLKLLEESLEWAETTNPHEDIRQREVIRTLDAHAAILMRLGRKMEAVARWQLILDRYPTYEDYAEIEKKIQGALGIDENGSADDKLATLLETCDAMELLEHLSRELFPRAMENGPAEILEMVRKIDKSCGDSARFNSMGLGTTFFNTAAILLVNQGECEAAIEVEKIMSSYPNADTLGGNLRQQLKENCD